MKFIFKRYYLIHTNLSQYVKTSNENTYHRGAKSCLGKWIPERIYPFIPDAMPYGIGQSRWSEQRRRRRTDRTNVPACNALGQEIPDRGYSRSEEQAREWPQAHHHHQGRQGRCKGSDKTASPEYFQSRSRPGESYRKTNQGRSLQEFLSAIAQDLDV